MCLFGTSFVSFLVPFLVSEPTFMCPMKDKPGQFFECSESFACADLEDAVVSFKFHSWAESLSLYCDNRLLRESGKSLCLLVNGIVCFITLNLSDMFGRRFVIRLNTIVIMMSLVSAYFVPSFYIKMFFIGIAFGCQGSFSSLFVFMMNEVSRRILFM